MRGEGGGHDAGRSAGAVRGRQDLPLPCQRGADPGIGRPGPASRPPHTCAAVRSRFRARGGGYGGGSVLSGGGAGPRSGGDGGNGGGDGGGGVSVPRRQPLAVDACRLRARTHALTAATGRPPSADGERLCALVREMRSSARCGGGKRQEGDGPAVPLVGPLVAATANGGERLVASLPLSPPHSRLQCRSGQCQLKTDIAPSPPPAFAASGTQRGGDSPHRSACSAAVMSGWRRHRRRPSRPSATTRVHGVRVCAPGLSKPCRGRRGKRGGGDGGGGREPPGAPYPAPTAALAQGRIASSPPRR